MKETQPAKTLCVLLFSIAAAVVVSTDLWSKHAVFEFLGVKTITQNGLPYVSPYTQDPCELSPNFFWLEANYNHGAFSGWFSGHTTALATVSVVALLLILAVFLFSLRKGSMPEKLFALAMGLLWGGAAGNLYDRALLGGVRDWIRWHVRIDGEYPLRSWGINPWPNFNVADAAICVGVALLIIREIRVAWIKRSSVQTNGRPARTRAC